MEAAKLLKNLWAEAISHHVSIRNRVPTRALKIPKTPLEMAMSQKPDLSGAYPWGYKVWVKRLDVRKLEPRAEECVSLVLTVNLKGSEFIGQGKTVLVSRETSILRRLCIRAR